MARLFILLFVLPWWAYFPLAGGVGWLTYEAYLGALETEAERAQALSMPMPDPVDLSGFSLDTDRHPGGEVHVTGWIDPDLNYELVKKTNFVTTSKRYMMAIFGAEDAKGTTPVRAVLLMTAAEKAYLTEHFDDYITGYANAGPRVAFNGFARVTDDYYSLVSDAIKDEGYTRDANFFYLKPFFDGREAALSPHGTPLKTLIIGALIAAAVAFYGIAQKGLAGRRANRAPAKDPAAYMPPPPPISASVQSYGADTPLGRIAARRRARAEQEDGTAMLDPAGDMTTAAMPHLAHPAEGLPDPLAGMSPATDRKANLDVPRRVRHLKSGAPMPDAALPNAMPDAAMPNAMPDALPDATTAHNTAANTAPIPPYAPGDSPATPVHAPSSDRAFYLKLAAVMLVVGTIAYDATLIVLLAPLALYVGLAVVVYRMGFRLRDRLRALLRGPEVI